MSFLDTTNTTSTVGNQSRIDSDNQVQLKTRSRASDTFEMTSPRIQRVNRTRSTSALTPETLSNGNKTSEGTSKKTISLVHSTPPLFTSNSSSSSLQLDCDEEPMVSPMPKNVPVNVPVIDSPLDTVLVKFANLAVGDVQSDKKKTARRNSEPNKELKKKSSFSSLRMKLRPNNSIPNFNTGTPRCEPKDEPNYEHIFKSESPEALIREMAPEERMKLFSYLENQPVPSPEKTTGLKMIETVQQELRSKQLLSLIEANADGFWNKFFLAGEAIIACQDCFSFIHAHLANVHAERAKIVLFQSFCCFWLKDNTGSVLVKRAEEEIKKIIAVTASHPELSVKKQSKRLQDRLQEALITPLQPTKLERLEVPHSQDFSKILEIVLLEGESASSYKELVQIVANDLRYRQGELYCHLIPQDFFQENYDPQLTSLDAYIKHTNLLTDYVIDTILNEKAFDRRVKLVKFFVDIGSECLNLKDYASASSVALVFINTAIQKMKNTLKEVRKSTLHKQALELLETLFSGLQNFKEFRACVNDLSGNVELYVPYIGLYARDIKVAKDYDTLTSVEGMDPMLNIEKMMNITASIEKCLFGQNKWKTQNMVAATYATNLMSHYLAGHQACSWDDRYDIAVKLADS